MDNSGSKTETRAGVPRDSPRIEPGGPRAAQRTLARDLPPDRRKLSRDRRAGRLAQSGAPDPDDLVAGLGAQRHGRSRTRWAFVRAAYVSGAAAARPGGG